MKYVFLIFALLVAGISADAVQHEVEGAKKMERFVDGIVNQIVANVTQTIIDEGLDPLHINREARQWGLSVPELFNVVAVIEDVLILHLSDIRIIQLNFSLLTLTVNYHFSIPHIHISTSYTHIVAAIFGEKVDANLAGQVDIHGGFARGVIRVLLGVNDITIRELEILVGVTGINSAINEFQVYKYDLVDRANNLISNDIPGWLTDFQVPISTLLEIVLWEYIERALNAEWE